MAERGKNPFEDFINKQIDGVDNLSGHAPKPADNTNDASKCRKEQEIKKPEPVKSVGETAYDRYLHMIAKESGKETVEDPEFKKLILEILEEANGMTLGSLVISPHKIRYINALLLWAIDEQKMPAEKMAKAFLLGMIFQRIIFFKGLSGGEAPKSGGGDPTAKNT